MKLQVFFKERYKAIIILGEADHFCFDYQIVQNIKKNVHKVNELDITALKNINTDILRMIFLSVYSTKSVIDILYSPEQEFLINAYKDTNHIKKAKNIKFKRGNFQIR